MTIDTDSVMGSLFNLGVPSAHEQDLARLSAELLTTALKPGEEDVEFTVEGQDFTLPTSVVKMLLDMLAQMARGNMVSIVPSHAELTTQQAADTLNVSRPFLVKLLEEGKLPFRMVGTHRRIRFDDLMNYQAKSQKERLKILAELQADAQKNDMGY